MDDAVEYARWFDAIRKEGYYIDGGGPEFEAYLSDSFSPAEAATRVTARDPKYKLPAESKIGQLWTLLLFCAEDCPGAHQPIIELLKCISELPKSTEKGAVNWAGRDARTAWGRLWRESNDSLWSDTISKSRGDRGLATNPIAEKWKNYQAFSAACAIAKVMAMDNELFMPLILIVAVLEKERKIPELEMDAPAAAQWFLIAGKTLFNQKVEKSEETNCGWDTESKLWKGKRGFSKERWVFWKERWAAIESTTDLSDETKELCRKVLVAMNKVERMKK